MPPRNAGAGAPRRGARVLVLPSSGPGVPIVAHSDIVVDDPQAAVGISAASDVEERCLHLGCHCSGVCCFIVWAAQESLCDATTLAAADRDQMAVKRLAIRLCERQASCRVAEDTMRGAAGCSASKGGGICIVRKSVCVRGGVAGEWVGGGAESARAQRQSARL